MNKNKVRMQNGITYAIVVGCWILVQIMDKTGHMTNLKYVDLFLNAFDSRFFEEFQIGEFELHFLSQCFEGEELHVYKRAFDDKVSLIAAKDDEVPCAVASIFRK